MESSPLEFARPFWLYAGPVVCALLAWLMVIFARRRERDLAKLVHPRFRQRLLPGLSPRLVVVKRSLWLLAVLLLFTAVAGPRKGYEWREVKRRGIDILFAVDTSKSMLAEDLAPNRLERARMGIHDFIGRLKGDRVGLIPFAGSSYALCPLTLDYDAFRESLDALDTDLIPRQGTDVASAIREADRLFAEKGNNHRILVLITDGEDLQGDALEAAKDAAKNGMAVYPVGVGSIAGVTIPLTLPNGQKDVVRDEAGTPVTTKLDEGMLQKIAEATGGLYAALGRGAEGLDTIYREKLRLMPQNELDSHMEKIPLERFEWPLAAALVLLFVEFLLPDRRRPAKVRALPSAARRHAVPAATALLAMALLSENVRAAEDPRALYNEGTAAYEAGDFPKAQERLKASLNTPDLKLQNRAYYNLGNTLYRIGQGAQEKTPDETIKSWEDAIKAYGDALALDATDADARFNQEIVRRKLEELKKQQEKKDDQKKDDQKQDQKDEKKDEKKDEENKDQQKEGQDEKKQDEQKSGDKSKDQQGKGEEESEGEQNSEQHGDDQKQDDPNAEKKDDAQQGDEKKAEEPTGKSKPEQEGAEKKEGEEQPAGKEGEKKEEGQAGAEKPAGEKPGEEKKDGQEKQSAAAKEAGEEAKDQKGDGMSEERRTPGEMTKMEARQMLQALKSDQRTVIPLERPDPRQRQRFRDPNNTIKGKTW